MITTLIAVACATINHRFYLFFPSAENVGHISYLALPITTEVSASTLVSEILLSGVEIVFLEVISTLQLKKLHFIWRAMHIFN